MNHAMRVEGSSPSRARIRKVNAVTKSECRKRVYMRPRCKGMLFQGKPNLKSVQRG